MNVKEEREKKEKKREKKQQQKNLPDFNSLHPNSWAREVSDSLIN